MVLRRVELGGYDELSESVAFGQVAQGILDLRQRVETPNHRDDLARHEQPDVGGASFG